MSRGFTLIELLVVIAIIGLLSSVVLASLNTARENANIAAAQADLQSIRSGIELLANDTSQRPGGYSVNLCEGGTNPAEGNGIYINSEEAGIVTNDGNVFSGWRGPYLPNAPEDPWGQQYIYDSHYSCSNGENDCPGLTGNGYAVIHSGGPNGSGRNSYDTDNIAIVLCEH